MGVLKIAWEDITSFSRKILREIFDPNYQSNVSWRIKTRVELDNLIHQKHCDGD